MREEQHRRKILIIQTAFIGDVILATSLIESLWKALPLAQIDILVRKGNESLLDNNPRIGKVLVWNKKERKYSNLLKILKQIRNNKYNTVINIQRFAATGFLTAFSGAKERVGFKKNPFSRGFTKRYAHPLIIEDGLHEVERNHLLISHIEGVDSNPALPVLYPDKEDFKKVQSLVRGKYVVMAPGSVWFTKKMPVEKWIELTASLSPKLKVVFIGGKDDSSLADKIIVESKNNNCINLCGQLTFLESAALMKGAVRNIVNDSAPLHISSAVNAPVTAIFCSTVPEFGFGPLSKSSAVVEITEYLECRPCGVHGKKACPKGHFRCGYDIDINLIKESFERN